MRFLFFVFFTICFSQAFTQHARSQSHRTDSLSQIKVETQSLMQNDKVVKPKETSSKINFTISGKVIYEKSKKPAISSKVVLVLGTSQETITTDQNGNFKLSVKYDQIQSKFLKLYAKSSDGLYTEIPFLPPKTQFVVLSFK